MCAEPNLGQNRILSKPNETLRYFLSDTDSEFVLGRLIVFYPMAICFAAHGDEVVAVNTRQV